MSHETKLLSFTSKGYYSVLGNDMLMTSKIVTEPN